MAGVTLSTVELLKLAQVIVAADPPVKISQSILNIICEVIAGRQDCANYYSAQSSCINDEVARENEGHRYFINVRQTSCRRSSLANSAV